MLTPEEIAEIEAEKATIGRARAACIGALHVVQKSRGWISDESLCDIATLLGMSAAELEGVATYYNLIYRRPVGRHVVLVCKIVSCWLLGADALERAVVRAAGARVGDTSSDGRFTVLPNPCLGCCDRAPALMVGEDLHVAVDEPAAILERYR